jgi:hypothetical protein
MTWILLAKDREDGAVRLAREVGKPNAGAIQFPDSDTAHLYALSHYPPELYEVFVTEWRPVLRPRRSKKRASLCTRWPQCECIVQGRASECHPMESVLGALQATAHF